MPPVRRTRECGIHGRVRRQERISEETSRASGGRGAFQKVQITRVVQTSKGAYLNENPLSGSFFRG
ncbi:hypothetical protein HMPREF0298_1794 [Corynebacterium lipophiloflavum DSM 44291]|uniref:Uncharacterized protein n=1 Tax=Corynebacterium lipophiloflavum (strain ATCC 700352 / DSM 44291 / CCUG 37336 / JCM 10383 / DMMZ 1944) TaxID=525263 RepID=C0XTM4_CORLD|nr:hypothetical protein HMPREF0298_1794 [Corynebacterium lipophiloflavum DSM 44291]